MKRLQIGCGKCFLPSADGWVNLDLFDSVQADIYADMTALPYPSNTFELIYASHVLEHCNRRTILSTLAHWRDLLQPGGTLRVAVPNFEAVCEWYGKTHNLTSLIGLLYGGQNHPKNFHFVIFDKVTLTHSLEKVGFTNVREWDCKKTDHAAYDDYSHAVLPHMTPDGLSVSLNLEATKPA